MEKGKTIQDYITLYQRNELNNQIDEFSRAIGVDGSMLKHIIETDPTEQNLNEFNRFDNLKATVDKDQAKVFLRKITIRDVRPRMVMINVEEYLKKFILHPSERQSIIDAWHGKGLLQTQTDNQEESIDETFRRLETPQTQATVELDNNTITEKIKEIITTSLSDIARYLPDIGKIAQSILTIIDATSLPTLDGIGALLHRAFTNAFKPEANNIDKSVAFNMLSTQFEAFLKKLYYLIHHSEIQPSEPGQNVSWKDSVKAFRCLWGLKNNHSAGYQELYQKLELAKSWRNDQSHISPTSTDEELNLGLSVMITLYAFVAGSNLRELEMAENGIVSNIENRRRRPRIQRFIAEAMLNTTDIAAEPSARDLPEESRIDVLKKCINQLIGYTPENSPLAKQRNWEAVYRIAADYGFVINGDYQDFISVIRRMNITRIPSRIDSDILARLNTGIFAKDFSEWTSDGLTDRKLAEYEDIHACANRFRLIVRLNLAATGRN